MRPNERSSSQERRICGAAVVLGLVAISGLSCARVDTAEPTRPHIVLIVMDTVRPDHMSSYGYRRPTTPFLEELADSSRTFLNAYSTSCWTFPSHASLFTGLYPEAHSAHWEHLHLDETLVTLAEVFRDNGYRTVGISQNPLISRSHGFGQGFDTFSDKDGKRVPPDVAREFADFLDSRGPEPFFVFANIMAAHAPYNSSGQFFGIFLSDPSYKKQVDWQFDPDLVLGKETLPAELKLHMAEHYDAEIRFVDQIVRDMAEALRRKGLWESTVFIVTSDHGEALGERGYVRHQFSLYENVIRVPLIIHYPPLFSAAKEASFVQLTDLFPTLVSIVDHKAERYPSQGRSLLSGQRDNGRAVVTEYHLHKRFQGMPRDDQGARDSWQAFNRRLQSIRIREWKLIRGDDGHRELYNLEEDPLETRDLHGADETLEAESALVRALDEVLKTSRELARGRAAGNAPVGNSHEELRSLGYL